MKLALYFETGRESAIEVGAQTLQRDLNSYLSFSINISGFLASLFLQAGHSPGAFLP
jgi:hypothetical protein